MFPGLVVGCKRGAAASAQLPKVQGPRSQGGAKPEATPAPTRPWVLGRGQERWRAGQERAAGRGRSDRSDRSERRGEERAPCARGPSRRPLHSPRGRPSSIALCRRLIVALHRHAPGMIIHPPPATSQHAHRPAILSQCHHVRMHGRPTSRPHPGRNLVSARACATQLAAARTLTSQAQARNNSNMLRGVSSVLSDTPLKAPSFPLVFEDLQSPNLHSVRSSCTSRLSIPRQALDTFYYPI